MLQAIAISWVNLFSMYSWIAAIANEINGMNAAIKNISVDSSDNDLMAAYLFGNQQAFNLLYQRYRSKIFRYISGNLPASYVDDVFQETWMRVIKAQKSYAAGSHFQAWLYRIAHNCIVDKLREKDIPTDSEQPEHHETSPDKVQSQAQQAQWLKDCIAALPLAQRDAFLLKQNSGLNNQAIGEIIGDNAEAVKSRIRYATQKLRECLQPIWEVVA